MALEIEFTDFELVADKLSDLWQDHIGCRGSRQIRRPCRTVVYCDPPYPRNVRRSNGRIYSCEMSDDQHAARAGKAGTPAAAADPLAGLFAGARARPTVGGRSRQIRRRDPAPGRAAGFGGGVLGGTPCLNCHAHGDRRVTRQLAGQTRIWPHRCHTSYAGVVTSRWHVQARMRARLSCGMGCDRGW